MKKIIILSLSIFAAFSGNLSAQCQSGQCYQGQGYQGQGYQDQGYQGQGYQDQGYQGQGYYQGKGYYQGQGYKDHDHGYQGQGYQAQGYYSQSQDYQSKGYKDHDHGYQGQGRLGDANQTMYDQNRSMYDQNRSMKDGRYNDGKLHDGKYSDGRYNDGSSTMYDQNRSMKDGRYNDGSSTMYDQNRSDVTGARGATGAMVSDADLTKRVQDAIAPGYFSKGYERVTVRANGGTIILQGYVENHDDKQSLENAVRKIDGVRDINNQVMVQSAYGATGMNGNRGLTGATGYAGTTGYSATDAREFPQDRAATAEDSQINKRIRDQVSRGWTWDSYKEVTLDTKDGVVTLKGSANREVDLQKLITEIKKINGVRSVQTDVNLK